jgi:hypothetical protein
MPGEKVIKAIRQFSSGCLGPGYEEECTNVSMAE